MARRSAPIRKTYGRKVGRPLGKQRTEALDALLPLLGIPETLLNERHDLPPASLFSRPFKQYWLEIGFGQGEHLSALARRHPDTGYMGAEPFINGVAAILKDIGQDIKNTPQDLNIRLLNDDAMRLAFSLQENSLDGLYILNPDPWPKKRHHERRIVNARNLDAFAKILKPGASLILSTDVPDLADWMVTQTCNHPAFEWTAKRARDWQTPPHDWIPTRYELKKARHAEKMCYLIFTRK